MKRKLVPIGIMVTVVGGLTAAWAASPVAKAPGHVVSTPADLTASWNTTRAISDADCPVGTNDPSGPGISPTRNAFDLGSQCSTFSGTGVLTIVASNVWSGYQSTVEAVPNPKNGWVVQNATITDDAASGFDPVGTNVSALLSPTSCGMAPTGTSSGTVDIDLVYTVAGHYSAAVNLDLVPTGAYNASACNHW